MSESRSFYLWLAQVIFLLGLIALLLWLSLRPKTPNYTIVDFFVHDLNGENSTVPSDNGGQNTTFTFEVEIANPNKESGIYYDTMNFTLFYGDMYVGSTAVDPFYQGYQKTATRMESINTGRKFLKDVFGVAFNGTAQLKVSMATSVRYRIWGRKTKHHGLALQGCLPVGPDGKIEGRKKKIKLHHTRKKCRLH